MMKKSAFSYLELIISMGLVVMVVFLTTPFLTHMEKNTSAKFGEYRAYAKIDTNPCTGEQDWTLYQNTRRATTEYDTEEDKPCPCSNGIQICVFVLPNQVSNYKVHIYGAGGEGSIPYYDKFSSTNSNFFVAKGAGGSSGQFVTKIDTLARAVSDDDDSILHIYRCSDVFMSNFKFISSTKINGDEPKNCIATVNSFGSADSLYSTEVREDIKKRFIIGKFDESKLA